MPNVHVESDLYMSRILFASSEAHPLVKTGGLADVSGSLPPALAALGEEVRLVLPAYRSVLDRLRRQLKNVASLTLPGLKEPVAILEARLPETKIPVWLVHSPIHFDRVGAPYAASNGRDWNDNPNRFATFCRVVTELACDRAGLQWRPDVVHCNDWQSGLVPALLALETTRPATIFTIHNLAYQGQFPAEVFDELALPEALWTMHGVEFYGQLSFIKGGLACADWITTVSPTYAAEIRTAQFGYGLEGLLSHRATRLRGILNGCDYRVWDPRQDSLLPQNFDRDNLSGKAANKQALQQHFALPTQAEVPLIGLVGRLVEQKGIDLVIQALPELLERAQVALVGTGDAKAEAQLRQLAERYPGRLGLFLGYDEALAHLVEAGADLFLMPSRFEPCGLNQLYSLRYGTLPVVRRTGGLADTVVDATPANLENGSATGFVFDTASAAAMGQAVHRALDLWPDSERWQQLMRTGMAQDFSWEQSARDYQALYREAIAARPGG